MATLPKIIFVVGPTASGKTSFGIQLAQQLEGAILSADSRQIYVGMDIGTAKPTSAHHQNIHPTTTPELIDGIYHYFFNIRTPDQIYDLATWQDDAFHVIDGLLKQGITPLLVGGTMLYLDCVAFNYSIPSVPPHKDLRQKLEQQPVNELYDKLITDDPRAASFIQPGNKRRIIRALEVMAVTGQPFSTQRLQHEPKYDVEWVGCFPGWEQLEKNIHDRIMDMLQAGLIEETKRLQDKYGADLPLLQTLNYKQVGDMLAGTLPETELVNRMVRANMRYAHRQVSWWRTNKAIMWQGQTPATSTPRVPGLHTTSSNSAPHFSGSSSRGDTSSR